MGTTYPLLISIPHGGDTVPPEVAERVGITEIDIFYAAPCAIVKTGPAFFRRYCLDRYLKVHLVQCNDSFVAD